MIEKDYSFEDVVSRVVTKGGITKDGITDAGTGIINEYLPDIMNKLFNKP